MYEPIPLGKSSPYIEHKFDSQWPLRPPVTSIFYGSFLSPKVCGQLVNIKQMMANRMAKMERICCIKVELGWVEERILT